MLCLNNLCVGQNSLSGTVKDQVSGETIVGAALYLSDLKRSTSSDVNGKYIFTNIPSGKFIIELHVLGYQSKSFSVIVNGDIIQDVGLSESHVELSQVVVTGVSHATEIKRNPVPIVVVDKQYIDRTLSTNLIDALSKTPGVNTVTTGPNVSKPFIRGLGYNRILTLYDGIRQEGQQWGDEHGIEVDEYLVDKIEVVKGPASLIYGSDALGGVVNILPSHPVAEGRVLGSLTTNYQSNNGLYAGSVAFAGNMKGFSWSGRGTHKDATNYQDKIDGRVYGTGFHETDINVTAGLDKSWGFSHFSFSLFDDLQEIPDGSRDSATRKFTKQISDSDSFRLIASNSELNSYRIATLHQHVQHYKIYSINSFSLGNAGKIGLNLSYQQNIRREFSHPENADIPGLYLFLQTLTYDVKYYIPEVNGWETAIGINGMVQDNRNKGTEFIIPDYNLFDLGPFAFIKKAFNKLDISGGLRYDMRSFHNDELYLASEPGTGFDKPAKKSDINVRKEFSSYSHTFSGASGSVGATYNFTDAFLLKANIARGYRAPNISEIAANGVHPGTNIYQIGNPDFKPEFSLQEDLGFFFSSAHVSLSAEIFNNDITNYIYNQKLIGRNGLDSTIVQGNQTFKFVSAHAQLFGGEFNIDVHPHPLDWLHFENAVSLVYAMNKGGNGIQLNREDKYLPFIPPFHTRSELRANFSGKKHRFSNCYIKVEMEYYARQDRVLFANNTESPTPSYTLFNGGLGGDVLGKSGKILFSAHILGSNLWDAAYQSHLSRLKYFEPYPGNLNGHSGIYNMGRNISLKVIIPFSLK
jgi:iron complex outermembrane receptor protein